MYISIVRYTLKEREKKEITIKVRFIVILIVLHYTYQKGNFNKNFKFIKKKNFEFTYYIIANHF